MKTARLLSSGALALSLLAGSVTAAVSPDEAAKLGSSLTPIGAQKEGNADGSIPAWTGGLAASAGKVDGKGFLSDPFADEKPLFTITAQNVEQYKDKLSDGQLAMFKRYPETYRIPVYKTHRTVALPAEIDEAVKQSALNVQPINDGNGLSNFEKSRYYAFPVHETLDQVKEPRLAWVYNAGQRRVRRAPQVAYDGPGTAADGLRTSDNFDMFSGAPDRYDWKLVGKREMYIPYNAYKLNDPTLKYGDIIKAGHINQDLTRYELHRVWEVVGTVKPGERHIYAKRHMYIDEDSWQIALVDHYDGRGQLWRVGEGHAQYHYDQKVAGYTLEALYDVIAGRYLALGMNNEEKRGYEFGFKASSADYTPAALRNAGVR